MLIRGIPGRAADAGPPPPEGLDGGRSRLLPLGGLLALDVRAKGKPDLGAPRPVGLSRFLVKALSEVRVDPRVDVPALLGFRSQ